MFAVLNGDYSVFKSALSVDEFLDDPNVVPINLSLKSTSLTNFGSYFNQRKWDGNYILDVDLVYTYQTQKMNFYFPDEGSYRWIDVPVGVKYQFYCHQRVKRWYGWFDANTHLYHKAYVCNIGGNDSGKGFTYYKYTYSVANPSIQTSSEDLSNHYIELYYTTYPFSWNGSSDLSDLAAPSIAPVITNISFDIWTGKVGSETNCIQMRIN